MARHASAVKAARQAIKHNERNRQARATVRTALKNLRTAIVTKPVTKEKLVPMLHDVQKMLMKAASKNLLKRGTASRYVSRLSTAVHQALKP